MTDERRTNGTPPLWNDPVVEEVRAVRRRLWEVSGRDVRKFIEQSRQSAEHRAAAKPTGKHNAG